MSEREKGRVPAIMDEKEKIRILIADDHTLFREGLQALLFSVADTEVVGEAATGEEAIQRATETNPDVILMDIQMPDLSGIEATRRILAESSSHQEAPSIIVLTMHEDNDSIFAAMRAGARGYILKGADQEEMLRAIRAAAHGEALFGPRIAERIVGFFNSPKSKAAEPFPELTEREREVLELIAQGSNNSEIARKLFVSPKTVRNNISHIFSKLMVADRSEAIVRAREAGMGKEDNT